MPPPSTRRRRRLAPATALATASLLALGAGPALAGSEELPADVLDLSALHLTLPTGERGRAEQVDPDQLATFTDPALFHTTTSGAVLMRAPVQGATTSGRSGATRTELRQRDPRTGGLAAWDPDDGHAHTMTVTLRADATRSTDRQEVIVAQIHSRSSTPPLYLAVDQSPGSGDTLSVFAGGHKRADLLTGITPTTTVTVRISARGDATVKVSAAEGADLDHPARLTLPASCVDGHTDGWYFKTGAYNKSAIDDGGRGYTQVTVEDLTITGPATG